MERNKASRKRYAFRRKRMPGDGYERDCCRLKEGFFGSVASRIRPGTAAVMRTKMKLASLCDSFVFTKFLRGFGTRFLKTKIRSSSVGILCFGFLCAAISLFRLFLEQIDAPTAVMDLAFSLGVVLGTLPLALSRSTWSETLGRSVLASFWFDLLGGFREEELKREGDYVHGGRVSVIVGVALGLLSFFVSPYRLALAFLLLLLAGLLAYKPELGVSLLALSFAFLTDQTLMTLSLAVVLSFVWKGARGKRVFEWEPVDTFALLLLLVWGSGSLFGLTNAYTVLLGAMLYFLFSKLVTTARQAYRLSYVFVIVLFVFSFLFSLRLWADGEGADLVERIGILFLSDQGGFVVPLDIVMMLLPIAAVGAMQKGIVRPFSVAALALGLCTLLFSTSPGALICLALSLAVLTVLLGKRMIPAFIVLIAVVGAVFFLSPAVIIDLFSNVPALVTNALGEQERILQAVFCRDWFQVLFGALTPCGEKLNYWGDFLYRYGLTGILSFALFMAFLFRKAMGVWAFTKQTRIFRLCFGLQLSLGMLLLRGITSPFTDNATVFAFFWMVCGMLSGVSNVARAARRREER